MIIHPNGFHAYGMTSASMTFILSAPRSSYRGCEKTFAKAACELHPALPAMALDVIRSKGQESRWIMTVVLHPEFLRSTNLESKVIDFFAFLIC